MCVYAGFLLNFLSQKFSAPVQELHSQSPVWLVQGIYCDAIFGGKECVLREERNISPQHPEGVSGSTNYNVVFCVLKYIAHLSTQISANVGKEIRLLGKKLVVLLLSTTEKHCKWRDVNLSIICLTTTSVVMHLRAIGWSEEIDKLSPDLPSPRDHPEIVKLCQGDFEDDGI